MDTAVMAGLEPDDDGHWPSRVPSGEHEGLILKSPAHPTFHLTERAEREAGNVWWQDPETGRWYTFSKGDRATPEGRGLVQRDPLGGAPATEDIEMAARMRTPRSF